MDSAIITKSGALLAGIIGTAITVFKVAFDFSLVKRSQLREEYKFAKEFFNDMKSNDDLHPFLREKGYQAIAGTDILTPEEVAYLLSLKGSPKAVKNYAFGKMYLQHLPRAGNLQIAFKENYISQAYRTFIKSSYLFLYALFVFLGYLPLLLSSLIKKPGVEIGGLFLITLAFFGPYAVWAIREGLRMTRAEQLVKTQQAHTEMIILPEPK